MEAAERNAVHAAWLERERLTEKPMTVMITDTTTGETRAYPTTGLWNEDGEFQDYSWSDGNYACDCNRGLFFAEAAGKPDDDRSCGDSRFTLKILGPDGFEIYADDDT